jgi:lipopolysaccharide/colanic/teichoic acid biosynthesis glycosyltransferase
LVVLANGTIDGVDAEHQFNPTRFSVNDRALLRHSLQIPNSAQVVGFVGRIVGDKGIRELLEAFGALGDDFPNLHLLIVGAFERHQPLGREALATLENNARIHMVEFVADPAPYFSLMDVLAFPTYREGFGLVAAEASSMEVPVVTTQIPGCVDSVCDRVTGTLVPTRDAQSLAKAISAYLRDSECRRRHGRAGRNRVLRDFQPEQVRQALWRRYLWWMNAESSGSHGRSWPLTLFRRRIWGNVTEARSVCTYQHFGKRFLDLMISLPMFFVTLPLLAIVASMACWRLGRPILFWQERPGLHAKPFWMPKFRTMTDERDAQGELLPDVLRMTRLGRFLRSTSLDELPELWNVLRGDMSLVGPRPLLMEYLGHYSPEQARRHEAKPGITGWAQVNGRNAISWEEKFKHDVWYVDHQSLALDLKIVCRTVVTWLSRKGVSANDHATMPRFDGSTTVVVYRDQVA